jgi:hypothetical protein
MFETIEEVIDFYKTGSQDKNHVIYNEFNNNLQTMPILHQHFDKTQGYGELPFSWNWNLIIKTMENDFNFLEIGVYKGRILTLISLLSKLQNKTCKVTGITPLKNVGDKYSVYDVDDYLSAIQRGFSNLNLPMDNVNIINGLSQDEEVLNIIKEMELFDIIFIDGSHDYEVVCADITNYIPFLKNDGYLVMDDSSLYIENPGGKFKGHPDVGKAIIDVLDKDTRMTELYACGHNRVWKKIIYIDKYKYKYKSFL